MAEKPGLIRPLTREKVWALSECPDSPIRVALPANEMEELKMALTTIMSWHEDYSPDIEPMVAFLIKHFAVDASELKVVGDYADG